MDTKVSSGINISSAILGVLPADTMQVSKQLRELGGSRCTRLAKMAG